MIAIFRSFHHQLSRYYQLLFGCKCKMPLFWNLRMSAHCSFKGRGECHPCYLLCEGLSWRRQVEGTYHFGHRIYSSLPDACATETIICRALISEMRLQKHRHDLYFSVNANKLDLLVIQSCQQAIYLSFLHNRTQENPMTHRNNLQYLLLFVFLIQHLLKHQ